MKYLQERNDWFEIIKEYEKNKIVIIDNFYTEETCKFLKNKILNYKDIDFNFKYKDGYWTKHYYPNSYYYINEIVNELGKNFPDLKDKFFLGWIFFYDTICKGTKIHADRAKYTLNSWITPDECIEDMTKNGLIVYPIKLPEKYRTIGGNEKNPWNQDIADSIVKENNIKPIKIEYKYNRAVLFDGMFLHETNQVHTKPGKENQRMSFTLLFENLWK